MTAITVRHQFRRLSLQGTAHTVLQRSKGKLSLHAKYF